MSRVESMPKRRVRHHRIQERLNGWAQSILSTEEAMASAPTPLAAKRRFVYLVGFTTALGLLAVWPVHHHPQHLSEVGGGCTSVSPQEDVVVKRDGDAGDIKERPTTKPAVKTKRVPDVLYNPSKVNSTTPIKQISLLGERNTGTTWMTAHLRECFNHSLHINTHLSRHKHWFQHDVVPEARVRDTLVVAQFRAPCQWVEAMRNKCYRQPLHYKVDWETFVLTPWTMPKRLKYDHSLVKEYKERHEGLIDTSKIRCQENFTYNQINSCLKVPYMEGDRIKARAKRREERRKEWGLDLDGMSGQEPLYELQLDGSGRPYSSVVEMRADKIKNFLSVHEWDWVRAVLPIQYDEMVRKGTAALIDHVEQITGVEARCTPSPPQDRTPRKLADDYREWMLKNVDWESEALIGYTEC